MERAEVDFSALTACFTVSSSSSLLVSLQMSLNRKEVGSDERNITIIVRAVSMVGSSAQCVRLPHGFPRSVVHFKVKSGEGEGPASLTAVQFLCRHEVFQVLVICPDLELLRCSF